MSWSKPQSGRKRFPNWLRNQINSGLVHGLYWMDEIQRTFRVPWTRVDSPDFDLEKDAKVFQLWAEFTGRYKPGERTDPSVWKTRFRCAIRKMAEIEEITVANNLEEKNGRQPYRVFRFKEDPCVPKRKQIKRQQKTNQRYKANSKHQNKTGLTGLTRGVSHGGPSRAKEDYIQRGFLSHGVSFDRLQSSLSPRVTGDAVQYMEPQEKSTNQERPWPIISGPSYHQITDLSLQFGFTQLLPGNSSNYVTFEALQYFNSAHAQSSFPQLSLEDVNRELKSCDMPSQSMTSYDDDDVEHQQTSMITAIANNCVHDVTMATYLGFENSNQGGLDDLMEEFEIRDIAWQQHT